MKTHSATPPSGTVPPWAVSIRPWTTATPPPMTASSADRAASEGARFLHCRTSRFHVVTDLFYTPPVRLP